MAKKRSSGHNNINTANAVISFLVLLLAFSTLLLFRSYRDSILLSGNFNTFILLSGVGFGLLITLLFLVNSKGK